MTTITQPQKLPWYTLILCIALPLAIGVTASYFTQPEIPGWYASLNKPSFTPPNWLFAPVWTLLYIMMGAASYLILKSGNRSVEFFKARSVYVMQLVANFGWSFVFFNQHNLMGGMVVLFFLLVLIISCIVYFRRIDKTAAWLMAPYLVWVCYASALNYAIIILNTK